MRKLPAAVALNECRRPPRVYRELGVVRENERSTRRTAIGRHVRPEEDAQVVGGELAVHPLEGVPSLMNSRLKYASNAALPRKLSPVMGVKRISGSAYSRSATISSGLPDSPILLKASWTPTRKAINSSCAARSSGERAASGIVAWPRDLAMRRRRDGREHRQLQRAYDHE